MSSYSELIKNFEKIRAYMREFYVYGFKSREEYIRKSSRSYDDERRRLESWLGEHMSFVRTAEGKNVFISIDSRTSRHNPFYKAWKAKSFTDKDITLHFILFDIMHSPEIKLTLKEILEKKDSKYLNSLDSPMMLDESTVRKKLKEYEEIGIVDIEKQGRQVLYKRAISPDITGLKDTLHYFSEVAPCGVIGSYLLDKAEDEAGAFTFKHHYMTSAMDSGVLAALFTAMGQKASVTVSNLSRHGNEPLKNRVIPLRIFISVQNGRQHLLAYHPEFNCFKTFRLDYLSNVKIEEYTPRFDELRAYLDTAQEKMWGVCTSHHLGGKERLEHVEFVIRIDYKEEYIIRRLYREKRVGRIEKIDKNTYRFIADVYDTGEMLPWIRTFICRITEISFSNPTVEKKFKSDLEKMYDMYGIGGSDDIQ